jgi:hypothetical protein
VLQEFYVAVTRKLARPLDAAAAAQAVSSFAELPLVQIDTKLTRLSLFGQKFVDFSRCRARK